MYSSMINNFDGTQLLDRCQAKAQPLLLLIKGSTMTTDSNNDGNHCCYGAFLPQDSHHQAALFQLQPIHRVYWGTVRVDTKPSEKTIQTLQVNMRMDDSTEMCLELGGPGTVGSLPCDGWEKERFSVAAADLVGFPPNARGYDLKQDRRFWVERSV